MQSPWRKTIISVALIGGLIALARSNNPSGSVKIQRTMMGTMWGIEVIDHGRPDQARVAIDHVYAELSRIEDLMSEWKRDSPISQVDAAAGQHAEEVPAELRQIIERSIAYSRATEGTFDITWRGMGNIWHFDDSFVVPTQAEVVRARANIDYKAIQVQGDRIYLPAGKNIGLGGIAKGYAVDRAARVLAAAGFTDSLVDGGGDVLASGTRNGKPWRLGIQDPRGEHGEILGIAGISNMALVTSGDYERFRMVNGVRYHHIIDPRTGWPATASISVSVLAKTAEQGVVLAKSIFILGPSKGLELARAQGVEAMVIDPAQKTYFTDGFRRVFEGQ